MGRDGRDMKWVPISYNDYKQSDKSPRKEPCNLWIKALPNYHGGTLDFGGSKEEESKRVDWVQV